MRTSPEPAGNPATGVMMMNRIDEIVSKMEYVSAGMGEINERREEAALREWLADYDGEYTDELQAAWNAYCDENEPQYDETYD